MQHERRPSDAHGAGKANKTQKVIAMTENKTLSEKQRHAHTMLKWMHKVAHGGGGGGCEGGGGGSV